MYHQLNLLKQIAHGIAVHYGDSCEVVIHDLTQRDLSHTIVYIENGHVSGRKPGDGPSRIVFEALHRNPDEIEDRLSYLTKTESGQILKSSTMYIRGEDGSINYILSINFDISAYLIVGRTIRSFVSTDSESSVDDSASLQSQQPQQIVTNVNDLLDTLIDQALALVNKPVSSMNKDDKVRIVQFLNNAGAFLITKSSDKVIALLGISKFTLYNYMDAGSKAK